MLNRLGDCTNTRRVGSINCWPPTELPPEHYKTAVAKGDAAKNDLSSTDAANEIEIAVRKIRVLCED